MKKINLKLLIIAILVLPIMFTSLKANAQTIGDVLVGQYTYFDPEGDPEGVSLFQWYRDGVAIPGATSRNYTVTAEDVDHLLIFEVIPVALTGISPGAPIRSTGIAIHAPGGTGGTGNGTTTPTPTPGIILYTPTTATSTPVATTTITKPTEVKPFNSYLKLNSKSNNVEEVKMWQIFLNKELNINLPITGFYGVQTYNAIKQFQSKYSNEILKPWDISESTGYVYKTTRAMGNKLFNNYFEGKIILDNGITVEFSK